jgi:LPS-assembly protein
MLTHKIIRFLLIVLVASIFSSNAFADNLCSVGTPQPLYTHNLAEAAMAKELGWIPCDENRCGGFYIESPFNSTKELANTDKVQVTADQMTFAQHGTSIGQGRVTISRFGEQIVANKAYLYRDPVTGKLSSIDLIENVTMHEPDSLVIAKTGHFDLKTKGKSLQDILYRTVIYSDQQKKQQVYSEQQLEQPRKITHLSAWGQASEFKQAEPAVYEFQEASYSTCPPLTNTWRVKASHIVLDKNTGRGVARNARVYVKGVPIFYTPYINFPIDSRRQTGFLTPTMGTSSKTGLMLRTPFYWNTAPNYDSTITPAFFSTRGVQLNELFRYLTPTSNGYVNVAALPSDKAFSDLQEKYQTQYQASTYPYIQANLRRLEDSSDTRKSIYWVNNTRFNDHWTTNVDYSRVSDDYYLSDFSNNFDVVTTNQLLEQGQVAYQGQHWQMLGRVQGYQTLHPVDQNIIQNQYTRLPQIVIEGDYPNAPGNLDYFITNDLTHFTINKTPGSSIIPPMGNRLHVQPGIAWPYNRPYFYFTPRLQFALTKYELNNITTDSSNAPSRELPIFDIHSGLFFDRNINVFGKGYQQTLEPQIYYTYVPYRNQNDIPVFDTTVNTLTYDELFMYNRFSGLDRIGDANQISYGVTTRFIDDQAGYEKLRAGLGQILYFRDRKVTLCSPVGSVNSVIPCVDQPNNPMNTYNKSPLSGVLNYYLNPVWSLTANSIWDVQSNKFNNQSVALHYEPDVRKIVNLAYGYVFNGDIQVNDVPGSSSSNLSQTDFSFAWPLARDWSTVGRWTQNWNHHHFQNLLYGLQYDSCCWAVRFVTGRAFANLSPSNTYQYNTQFFIQFALKGLGVYGNADPTQLLSSSVSGYQTNFGQDY